MSPSAQLVPYCAVPAALTMLTHCVCIQLSLAVRILIVFVCLKLLNSCCVQLKKYLEEWSASPCCSNNLYFACDGSFPCCSSAAHLKAWAQLASHRAVLVVPRVPNKTLTSQVHIRLELGDSWPDPCKFQPSLSAAPKWLGRCRGRSEAVLTVRSGL